MDSNSSIVLIPRSQFGSDYSNISPMLGARQVPDAQWINDLRLG
jgi:hypothetical protein